jgi:hypothetical protein
MDAKRDEVFGNKSSDNSNQQSNQQPNQSQQSSENTDGSKAKIGFWDWQ